ncbi:MAG: hypothetical protein IPM29_08945 [Planctomycetes bacterium]|nr:hypothetical protein [Planctomycetota bacterium]
MLPATPQLAYLLIPWEFRQLAVSTLLLIALAAILTSELRLRQARRLVVARAAFLVPAVAATLALLALRWLDPPRSGSDCHENPFGVAGAEGFGQAHAANILVLCVVALSIAGHVGLLEAHRLGRRPDGFAFLAGVRRHGATMLLGKLLLWGGVRGLSELVPLQGGMLVSFLVPSALLAALPAFATRNPHRPLRALRQAVEHAWTDLGTVGWRVTLLAGFLYGCLKLFEPLFGGPLANHLLVHSTSTLSWNQFPFAQLATSAPALFVPMVGAVLVSTVSITAHWLAVNDPEQTLGADQPRG